MGDAFLRVWKPDRRGTQKYAGRSGISRVEVVKDDVVLAELSGLFDVHIKDPLDDVSYLVVKTFNFELKIEPREGEGAREVPSGRGSGKPHPPEFPMRLGTDGDE